MCGIAGIVDKNKANVNLQRLQKMTDAIAHRGPDGEGHWISNNGNVGFGHRRLSIIDLSEAGKQPMHYANNLTITYNGEIYNYIELKEQLQKKGYHFYTNNDTEVLLAIYHCYKEDCLQYLDGMFAFAIYDAAINEIFIARDRFGEKPFYYAYKPNDYFVFGSEMKALWAAQISKEVNNTMLYNYLQASFLENPNDGAATFYSHCNKLPHSHYIKINVASLQIKIIQYYTLNYRHINIKITEQEGTEQFSYLLNESIKKRLRSDVEVGSSLSGGLDSSIIVTSINELNKNNAHHQNTFSAVFPGFEKDERKYIDAVVANKNINAHFVQPTIEGFVDNLQKLCWHHEEPFDGPSIYAQYCVMQLAKQNKVKVLLDGQGADEILAGYHYLYNSFFSTLKKEKNITYRQQLMAYKNLYGVANIEKSVREKIQALNPSLLNQVKKIQLTYQQISNPILSNDFYAENKNINFDEREKGDLDFNTHLYKKTFTYGLQQLLQHADRNSMANGVEVRLPFLNKEVVEFLFRLPSDYKINNGYTKWIARKAYEKQLPNTIVWRKDKIAYEVPQHQWTTTSLYNDSVANAKQKLIDNKIISNKAVDINFSSKQNWKILMAAMLY
ncbi:MAG: asparagine synthase (glutamine-hydrolyzing) [Ferruginibacter sp.]|nr:asparagine synthase (glutamine-hydrolyzing) [Ferruginibacter sp.]